MSFFRAIAGRRELLAALLESLAGPEAASVLAGVTRLEAESGCRDVKESDPHRLQDATQLLLRRQGLLPRWRHEIDEVFQTYRGKTLYLLLAEGVDEMLAIRPDRRAGAAGNLSEATLPEVSATIAGWLGGAPGTGAAPPIAGLA